MKMRLLDAAGLLLLLAGGVVYGWAWLGLREIDAYERPEGAPLFATIEHAESLDRLSTIGIGLIAAGAVIAISAAVLHARIRRRGRADPEAAPH